MTTPTRFTLFYRCRLIAVLLALGTTAVDTRAQISPQPNGAAAQTADPRGTPSEQRERWNREFSSGIPNLRNAQSSEFLAAVIKGRKPAAALDLGIGQGRNAIFLAERGWNVTGVDISDVAVEQARKNAQQKHVTVTTVISDLDEYDFGESRWDLVTSFYMHSWHKNSQTDVPARILRSLKPGGLFVMEAFRRPPNINGLVVAELTSLFRNFRIVMNEEAVTKADWGSAETTPLVRFVAEKPAK